MVQLILIIKHLEEGWFFEKTKLELRTHARFLLMNVRDDCAVVRDRLTVRRHVLLPSMFGRRALMLGRE